PASSSRLRHRRVHALQRRSHPRRNRPPLSSVLGTSVGQYLCFFKGVLVMTRDEAWQIVSEYVKNESLRKHMLAVEACMRAYARHFGEDEQLWATIGLLHDFDFEIHPTLDRHPQDGAAILRERGVPDDVIYSVLSHADHLQS